MAETITILNNQLYVQWGSAEPYIGNSPFVSASPGPECRYQNNYLDANGCGSYVADWFDPPTIDNPGLGEYATYYMLKKDSTSLADRGERWFPNSPNNGNCAFCPAEAYDCPNIRITKVTVSPPCPKQGEAFTLNVEFSYDLKGYTLTTSGGADTNFKPIWSIEGHLGIVQYYTGNNVTINNGFALGGTYKGSVGVSYYYSDPNGKCPVKNLDGTPALDKDGNPVYDPPFVTANFPFEITVLYPYQYNNPPANCPGGTTTNPDPDPDPTDYTKPTVATTLSGPTTVQLGRDGTAQADYVMDYVIQNNDYTLSNRPPYFTWDGKTPQTTLRRYTRTFDRNSLGSVKVTSKIALMFCQPTYTGPCTVADTADDPDGKRHWLTKTEELNVTVKDYVDTTVPPSGTISLVANTTSPTLNSSNEAFVTFTATVNHSNGVNYTPTQDPTAMYLFVNNQRDANDTKLNVTNYTWTKKFTSAGTVPVKARWRKNYTDPDGAASPLIIDSDVININVQSGAPQGTLPTVSKPVVTFSNNTSANGCGLFVQGGTVTATITIRVTQGTGDYEWSRAIPGSASFTDTGGGVFVATRVLNTERSDWQVGTSFTFEKPGGGLIKNASNQTLQIGSGTTTYCTEVVSIFDGPGGTISILN